MFVRARKAGAPCVASLIACLALGGAALAGDYDFEESRPVEAGASIVVRATRGVVYVSTWDRDEIRIYADHGEDGEVELREIRDILIVSASKEGNWIDVDFDITVPRWMDVGVEGHSLDVELEQVGGRVEVEVVDGRVFIQGGKEKVFVRNVQGPVRIEHAEGRIDVASNQENITVLDSAGQILAESISGDIRIASVQSFNVEAISVSGDLLYDGSLEENGDYYFSSHNGDIQIGVAEDASVAVTVIAEKGDFSADFELRLLPLTRKGKIEFVLGDGDAKLRAESFSGHIQLFDPKKGRGKRRG